MKHGERPARAGIGQGFLLAVTVCTLGGCDTLECGEGTHRSGDLCVSNVQVTCADGTVLRDGRCVRPPEADVGASGDGDVPVRCGPGTRLDGDECVPDEGRPPSDAAPQPDGAVADMRVDPDDGIELDAAPDQAVPPDAGPEADMAPPQRCPDELVPGEAPGCDPPPNGWCVHGVATNFVTGCALPADADLWVYVIDPIAAAGGAAPEDYTVSATPLNQQGGTFSALAVASAQQIAVVIDEDATQPGLADVWTRSVTGVQPGASANGERYQAQIAFSTDQVTQARWNDALGLGEGGLESTGFLVGRVLTPTQEGLRPVPGAQVRAVEPMAFANIQDCEADQPCLRFFNDDPRLLAFQPEGAGATGGSGGFLMILRGRPVMQAGFTVVNMDGFTPQGLGASQGSGVHTLFVQTP